MTTEHEQRRNACSAQCTLNGKPAKITGSERTYATVTALPDGERYDWTWTAVYRILATGGRFVS